MQYDMETIMIMIPIVFVILAIVIGLILYVYLRLRQDYCQKKGIPLPNFGKNLTSIFKIGGISIVVAIFAFAVIITIRSEPTLYEKIESHFSSKNGSHTLLTNVIKNNLKDPKSYEHIKTTYKLKIDEDLKNKYNTNEDILVVKTQYRAKNSYNEYDILNAKGYYTLDSKELLNFIVEIDLKETQKERIHSHFYPLGGHTLLTNVIKNNLKDPKSYEHIKTTYKLKIDKDLKNKYNTNEDILIVKTQYRAKNSFGGYVVETAIGLYTLDSKKLLDFIPN